MLYIKICILLLSMVIFSQCSGVSRDEYVDAPMVVDTTTTTTDVEEKEAADVLVNLKQAIDNKDYVTALDLRSTLLLDYTHTTATTEAVEIWNKITEDASVSDAIEEAKWEKKSIEKEVGIKDRLVEIDKILDSKASNRDVNKISVEIKNAMSLSNEEIAAYAKRLNSKLETERKVLMNKMRTEYDDIREVTSYYDKSSPKYTNVNNFHVYVSKEPNTDAKLNLGIRYADDDWLFIEDYTIKADNKVFDIFGSINRDNDSSGVWEWLDTEVYDKQYDAIKAVAYGKNVKIRYNGDQYYKDRVITEKEKLAIRNVLDVYEFMGGEYKK